MQLSSHIIISNPAAAQKKLEDAGINPIVAQQVLILLSGFKPNNLNEFIENLLDYLPGTYGRETAQEVLQLIINNRLVEQDQISKALEEQRTRILNLDEPFHRLGIESQFLTSLHSLAEQAKDSVSDAEFRQEIRKSSEKNNIERTVLAMQEGVVRGNIESEHKDYLGLLKKTQEGILKQPIQSDEGLLKKSKEESLKQPI